MKLISFYCSLLMLLFFDGYGQSKADTSAIIQSVLLKQSILLKSYHTPGNIVFYHQTIPFHQATIACMKENLHFGQLELTPEFIRQVQNAAPTLINNYAHRTIQVLMTDLLPEQGNTFREKFGQAYQLLYLSTPVFFENHCLIEISGKDYSQLEHYIFNNDQWLPFTASKTCSSNQIMRNNAIRKGN